MSDRCIPVLNSMKTSSNLHRVQRQCNSYNNYSDKPAYKYQEEKLNQQKKINRDENGRVKT